MLYKSTLLFVFALLLNAVSYSQTGSSCAAGESEIIIELIPDNYPNETSWVLYADNIEILTGLANGDTICVDSDACIQFTINDSYGDGICCAYGIGSYAIYFDGQQVATGGEFTTSESHHFNCPPGSICDYPFIATVGSLNAILPYSFYEFTPDSTGMYSFSTCGTTTCDTKLWIYPECSPYVYNYDNTGTLFYNDDGCGFQSYIDAFLFAGESYIIKVGLFSETTTCSGTTIAVDIIYNGPLTGCMDPNACNYDPNATAAGDCYYFPDPNCPGGPDLVILQDAVENSLNMRTEFATQCMLEEGCMNGYGDRTVLAFDTWIKNIGDMDYYIGNPTSNPSQFSFGNCHGHAHYEGYADYILYTVNGQSIPIGHKNGFCVMDLECSDGGTAQYGCSNMGITKQCGDIYNNALDCQWIDITDVAPGEYILAVKVNWDQSPDALGHYESTYENNWAQVCIEITENAQGEQGFQILPNCDPYVDCNGVTYGNSTIDCEGICGGSALRGDLNADTLINEPDALLYLDHSVNNDLSATECNDLSSDGEVDVWDAALANNCSINGAPNNTECVFPSTVENPNQIVILGNIEVYGQVGDPTSGYMDVYVKNIQNEISGYEVSVTGATVTGASNLVSGYPFEVHSSSITGEAAAISLVDSILPKYTDFTPFLRIDLADIGQATNICLDVIQVLNDKYQPVTVAVQNNCLSTLGVEEAQSFEFLVYPNPASDLITISFPDLNEDVDLIFFDARGREVKSIEVSKGTKMLQTGTNDLAPGIYRVLVKSDKVIGSKAISVRH